LRTRTISHWSFMKDKASSMKTVPFVRADGRPLKLEVIRSRESIARNRPAERHRHAFHSILFVREGRAIQEVDFTSYEVHSGTVLILPKGAGHREPQRDQFDGWEIIFTEDFFSQVQLELLQAFMHYAIARRKLLITVPASALEALSHYFKLISLEETRPHNQNQTFILQNLMLALLNRLEGMVQHLPEQASFIEKRKPFQQFVRLVEGNYLSHKGLDFYVEELQLTARKLNDILKELTGQTAANFIIDRLMLDAKRELCFSEKSVKQIAYQLGYDNPYYFSRIFKKRNDMSPEQFRQEFAE